MGLSTAADRERLEEVILTAMERQRRNGEAVRFCVSIADVRAALGSERESAVHAWAHGFREHHGLSVSLLGGGRMLFPPAEAKGGATGDEDQRHLNERHGDGRYETKV